MRGRTMTATGDEVGGAAMMHEGLRRRATQDMTEAGKTGTRGDSDIAMGIGTTDEATTQGEDGVRALLERLGNFGMP